MTEFWVVGWKGLGLDDEGVIVAVYLNADDLEYVQRRLTLFHDLLMLSWVPVQYSGLTA